MRRQKKERGKQKCYVNERFLITRIQLTQIKTRKPINRLDFHRRSRSIENNIET